KTVAHECMVVCVFLLGGAQGVFRVLFLVLVSAVLVLLALLVIFSVLLMFGFLVFLRVLGVFVVFVALVVCAVLGILGILRLFFLLVVLALGVEDGDDLVQADPHLRPQRVDSDKGAAYVVAERVQIRLDLVEPLVETALLRGLSRLNQA